MGRRLLMGVGDTAFVLGLTLTAVSAWFALTLFPYAVCLVVAAAGLALRLCVRPYQNRRVRRGAIGAGVAFAAFGLTVVGAEVVQHVTRSEARLQSRHVRSTVVGALLGVVPEADLASLGVKASGLLRMWPPEQMAKVHRLMRREYRAMRRDPAFASVGNVAANGFLVRSGRHFFRYLSRDYIPDRTWPLLVFLHGSSGNLVLYSWLWSRFADERGFVVLCPTWDNGRWEEREGTQAALEALDETLRECAIDGTRVFLAGQSAGAMGGWAVLKARPEAFRGFVCISGARGLGWDSPEVHGIPVLLIHGGEDEAISVEAARGLHKALLSAGRAAEFAEFPDEDHFLLLRSNGEVHEAIWGWMHERSGGSVPWSEGRR